MAFKRVSDLARFRPIFLVVVAVVFCAAGKADVALNIIPTFDSSITSDVNAAAIEGTINSAITYYQNTFTTATVAPINVTIDFKEMGSGLGSSNTFLGKVSYTSFITALHAASSGNATDTTALASLPIQATNPVTGSTFINGKTANLRALGFTLIPPGFDGVIGLNTSITNPPNSPFSLFAVTEHEIDEVLGLGSDVGGAGFFADPAPEDLYRYTSTGARSYTTAGDDAYFSLDGTTDLVQFNQSGGGADYGDWHTSATVRVQDAFGTASATPTLANDGGAEVIALDAIGYNLAGQGAVPEPSLIWLLLAGSALLVGVSIVRGRASARES
jgi:hypothetical protein